MQQSSPQPHLMQTTNGNLEAATETSELLDTTASQAQFSRTIFRAVSCSLYIVFCLLVIALIAVALLIGWIIQRLLPEQSKSQSYWTETNILMLTLLFSCLLFSCIRQIHMRLQSHLRQGTQHFFQSQQQQAVSEEGDLESNAGHAGELLAPNANADVIRRMFMQEQDADPRARLQPLITRLRLLMTDRDFNANDYETLLELDAMNREQQMTLGLSEADVNRLPTFQIPAQEVSYPAEAPEIPVITATTTAVCSESLGKQLLSEQCPVCLERYQAGEVLMTLPCLHRYHKQCISQWLQQKNQCAVCLNQVL